MNPLTLIKLGSTGPDVENWQYFLLGQHLFTGIVDGDFDQPTLLATVSFQKAKGLEPDGIVGNKTYGAAMMAGLNVILDQRTGIDGNDWPPKPGFLPLVTNADREKIFGHFSYIADPTPDDPEQIRITDDWEKKNIEVVTVPQLKTVTRDFKIQFHKLAVPQLIKLFADWEKAGLLHFILSWDGSFNPRFVRGSRTSLSNHSFGSAFDINEPWNKFHTQPALVGQKGCVRELVQIANSNGFYWGGHFTHPDGMHFEIAEIL